ncbi:phosphodiesterase [Acidovorax sp. SUPP950]|uniref:HD-GYP domain-containing protein n=1 Tax=unclassified Acidovorax TaxID=2684926 RepID=UPI0023C9C3BB|nr:MULTISPECIES: HD domain-containing phosphohydrolase [Comamonadaceae]WOI47114.1 phosphodiesterase [Paracidovorax avenae]GKS77631.1 phosphodiesterase [Acidovorax sp. SUPP950]GKS95273.1 phosphodiesterase [Acidovorax sp. SUPP2825]
MPHSPPSAGEPSDSEYEDLLGLWSDLESALAVILSRPLQVHDFPAKVRQCDRWLQELVAHDIDAALYLMFQLASTSTVGYSTSHALVCGTLCHILAHELQLPSLERDSLVRAAITMNIGMTALQDELASQRERPSPAQQEAIEAHPLRSMTLLEQLDVKDPLWLDVVGQHHAPLAETQPLAGMPAEDRLSRILGTIDRYAAMISPRKSRAGRSATDSVRAIVGQDVDRRDEVTYALVRAVGLCPPGTFVRLDNGETALVLRRSEKVNAPLVASLLDRDGEHLAQPRLHQTASGRPRIQSALARPAVKVEINHRTLVRLGHYAAQHSSGLMGLVSTAGRP